MWFIGVEVEQETSAPPSKKNPGSAPVSGKETEWTLQPSLFKAASDKLGVIRGIDLFASRLNYHLKPYVAYKPDPEAHAINAFHVLCC